MIIYVESWKELTPKLLELISNCCKFADTKLIYKRQSLYYIPSVNKWDSKIKAHCHLSIQFSHSVVSDSLPPHGLQQARLPCPSLTPRACSDSCPSSWWCHPAISSSVVPFSSCPQFSPASGCFLSILANLPSSHTQTVLPCKSSLNACFQHPCPELPKHPVSTFITALTTLTCKCFITGQALHSLGIFRTG